MWVCRLVFGFMVCMFFSTAFAQEKNGRKWTRERLEEARKKAISSITTSQDTTQKKKSEEPFLPFEGRIIRNIIIDHIGFERSIYDTTSKKFVHRIGRFANNLHQATREKTIRNNLFVYRNQPLNPYKVADNERHLRDLDFILDARIQPQPVSGSDSVDLYIVTRDVFGLGGSFSPRSFDTYRFGIYDVNIDGRGQRVQLNGIYSADRSPQFGHQFLYAKNSIGGSLVNATVSYTQINNGSSLGLEDEYAFFIRLDRPLVSPYTRMAGGIELSHNWSVNTFQKADTIYRNYSYNIQDFWVGYNIGVNNQVTNRNRHFVALRYSQQRFTQHPIQTVEKENPLYNNKSFVLGSLTFFNQNFYKSRYIYGFGRTEDVPYGKYLTLTTGSVRQFHLIRPYVGAEFDKTLVRKNGDFHEYKLQAEGFLGNGKLEDVTLLASASLFSKLVEYRQLKIRQYLKISYTSILKQQINTPLTIRSEFGLEGFRADSLVGTNRLSLYSQTVVFTPLSILGFRFAPLTFAQVSIVAPKDKPLFRQKAYGAIGAGLRTRNENLVFGTIELKLYYFPRVTEDLSHFRVSLSSNLQIKYSFGFAKAPEFIRYN